MYTTMMYNMIIMICARCKYEWKSKVDNPKACPLCKRYINSPYASGSPITGTMLKPQDFEDAKEVKNPKFVECDKQFCRSKTHGLFKVVTNEGTEEWIGNLCVSHWARAKREGEVHEA